MRRHYAEGSIPPLLAVTSHGSAGQWSGRLFVKEKIGGSSPLGTAVGSVADVGEAAAS